MQPIIDSALSSLSPQPVWHWFACFCAIPHPSHHEQALSDFIVGQANKRGLQVECDSTGNIRIRREASPALKNAPTIGMQAHIDMVAQRGSASQHDFLKDPIQTIIEDDWVRANDTTLGADNGIGAALGLALIFSDSLTLPALTLILTVQEETGMDGAFGLSPDWFDMPYLLNLDTEEEGSLYVGCAGGCDVSLDVDLKAQEAASYKPLAIRISGLKGGHSGMDIDKSVASANILMIELLSQLREQQPFGLQDLNGGTLRNAIARDAQAVIAAEESDTAALLKALESTADKIREEYRDREPGLVIEIDGATASSGPASVASPERTRETLNFLSAIPNGVIKMSDAFEGVVETSISMGVLSVKDGKLNVHSLMRSLKEEPKKELGRELQALAQKHGAQLELSGDYPGWEPDPESMLLKVGKEVFKKSFGQSPEIKVVHAGLECGLLKGHAPQTDMISFGPNIENAHSPRERVQISSVQKNWDVLVSYVETISQNGV